MGTFHQDRGALHGITVVVETTDDAILIGRFDREEPRGILLLDVARHPPGSVDGTAGVGREEFIARAVRFGVWKEHDAMVVPRTAVRSIRRLGELASEAGAAS